MKVIIVIVSKIGDNSYLKIIFYISLMPICGKNLEKLVPIFWFQSDLKIIDSHINELVSINHPLYFKLSVGIPQLIF